MVSKLQRLPILLVIFLLALSQQQLPSIRNAVAETVGAETSSGLTLSWKFEISTKTDENGTEVPETDLAIAVNTTKVSLGRFTGYPAPVKNLKKSRMPANAIIACKTWFSGQGDDFYAAKIDGATVGVYHRHVDEADDAPSRFHLIKRIIIPLGSAIRH